jgi:two-component system sensor histidine kinase KdpD
MMDVKRFITRGGGYPLAVLAVAAVVAAILPFRAVLPPPAVMLACVPVIVALAYAAGPGPSAVSALAAFVAVNFFFVPPYHRLSVSSPSEWVALVVFLLVALVSGQQAARVRERELTAVRRRNELELLNRLSFRIAGENAPESTAQFVAEQVAAVLGAERASVYVGTTGAGAPRCIGSAGAPSSTSGEAALVAWALRNTTAIGLPEGDEASAAELPSVAADGAIPGIIADGVYLPLMTGGSPEGVLFVSFPASKITPVHGRFLVAVANLMAAVFERQRLEEESARAAALKESDRLKSTLVSSVSHELKTPLAAATARITGLIDEFGGEPDSRSRQELVAVAEDLGRLNDSIADLLDLSRLESDAWRPQFEQHEIGDVLGTVVARMSADDRARVRFELAPELPLVAVDFAQLARAITNLIDNALRYSPAEQDVVVGAAVEGGELRLWVLDRGPGVADAEKPLVFDKFFRGAASGVAPGGTGLGLAICHEIVRSHGGNVWVEDGDAGGARFILALPLPDADEGRT